MKNSIYKIHKVGLYLVPVLFLFALLSCESLEVETPTHLLSGETLFTESGKRLFGPVMATVIREAEKDILAGRESYYD